ncbi:hypothetical protein GCM10009624_05360 [Gordonia sinesedis]
MEVGRGAVAVGQFPLQRGHEAELEFGVHEVPERGNVDDVVLLERLGEVSQDLTGTVNRGHAVRARGFGGTGGDDSGGVGAGLAHVADGRSRGTDDRDDIQDRGRPSHRSQAGVHHVNLGATGRGEALTLTGLGDLGGHAIGGGLDRAVLSLVVGHIWTTVSDRLKSCQPDRLTSVNTLVTASVQNEHHAT